MRTTFDMLVVGDVPEALQLDDHDLLPTLHITHAQTGARVDELLDDHPFDIVLTAAFLDDADTVDLVARLKEQYRFRPVVMVALPEHADRILRAFDVGLDEKLIRCEQLEHTVDLLALTVRRCLEYLAPEAYTSPTSNEVALHKAVYDNVTQSVTILDDHGRVIYFNRAADAVSQEYSGTRLQVGKTLELFYSGYLSAERRERVQSAVARALDGKRTLLREDLSGPTLSRRLREYEFAPVRDADDQIIAASIVSRDLGEVLDAEEKLEASEARFWQFFENLPVGVTIIGGDGRWLRVNPAVEELFGRSADELIGMRPSDITHPDDIDATVQTIGGLLSGERDVTRLQKRLYHRDGHIVWCDITGVAMPTRADGEPQLLGIITDVTLRRQLEEQLQETEKMRLVGQLAGGIAHDFNNLLTVINSYTHYVHGELGEDSPHAFALEKVMQAAQRGSSLTDQLLAFSRRQIIEPRVVDLNVVVSDVRDMLERLLRPDIDVRIVPRAQPTPIWIDRGQLEQVLFNLVMNARDAMDHGGTLSIEVDQRHLPEPRAGRIEAITAGDYGLLIVRDTGTGIAPEALEHIFEPFFTTKEVGQGTGLGLASSWGIVKQAGGHIDVDTKSGVGTSFTVYLPTAEPPAGDQADESPSTEIAAVNATVLLVEDDLEVREALRRFLDRRGFQVLEADTGAQALECADEYDDIIDILLTDVVMPGLSGRELAAIVHQRRPATRIFLMSGYPGEHLDGAPSDWTLLRKPIDLDELDRLLEKVLA